MCSVLFMKAPTYEMSQLVSQYNPNAFFYSFEFDARNSLFIYIFNNNPPPIPHGIYALLILITITLADISYFQIARLYFDISGVDHGDELIYLFVYPFPSVPPGLNKTETDLSMKMLQTWTNFVKYG